MKLFTPQMLADPYPFYAWLRDEHPIYFDTEHGFWLVTRYADVDAALRDPRLLSGRGDSLEKLKETGEEDLSLVYKAVADMVLFCDPPKHMRLRALTQKAFTPRALARMHAQVQTLVDGLIVEMQEALASEKTVDFVERFAVKLPMFVIAEMLGVPRELRASFQQWTEDFNTFTGKVNTSANENDRTVRSMKALFNYFRARVNELRTQPEENLLSDLVQAEEQGNKLSEDELLANCVLLLAAGFETTAAALGNSLLALLQHPGQIALLMHDESLINNAVEELLRYDGSVQFTGRMAGQDLVMGAQQIRKGDFVMLLMGAANRDPRRFAQPDVLDVTRKDVKHLGFGYGPHFCLGAPLARLEMQIALRALLHRLPHLQLAANADELQWRDNFSVRGLVGLPVGTPDP
jgi:pimeloyl-[acyl-carrier protein] synthase